MEVEESRRVARNKCLAIAGVIRQKSGLFARVRNTEMVTVNDLDSILFMVHITSYDERAVQHLTVSVTHELEGPKDKAAHAMLRIPEDSRSDSFPDEF